MNEALEHDLETPEGRFNELLDKLIGEGWPRRRAKRYLMALAKRETSKLIREGRRRQAKLRAEGKMLDTSEISAQLDAELDAELAQAGLSRDDLEDAQQTHGNVLKDYVPPTNEF